MKKAILTLAFLAAAGSAVAADYRPAPQNPCGRPPTGMDLENMPCPPEETMMAQFEELESLSTAQAQPAQ